MENWDCLLIEAQLLGNVWDMLGSSMTTSSLPHSALDWKMARLRVTVSMSLVITREGEGTPASTLHRSHYVNRIGPSSFLRASSPWMVPRVSILFCPKPRSWVMDRAEPANAWCNCQRDLIISTLHAGLLCHAVSSSLSDSLESVWLTGGGVLPKAPHEALLLSYPSENLEQQWLLSLANFSRKLMRDCCSSHIISPLHKDHSPSMQDILRVSLIAQLVKNLPAMRETWFNPWVGKIPWRRERLPTPVFWPGEFHGLYSPWGCKSWTRLGDFHFHFQTWRLSLIEC